MYCKIIDISPSTTTAMRVHPQANGGLGNEKYMNVERYACHDIVCSFTEKVKKFIRELRDVANHVNTRPNSLGRMDKHKINFTQKQLHPSMIGLVDLLESSKDVGQSGMISPWANIDTLLSKNINKYPNIKYDLFKFICDEFNDVSLTFDCDNIVDFNRILDHLAMSAYVNFEYKIPEWNPISDPESE